MNDYEEYEEYTNGDYEESGNAPCDTYGLCAGSSCPYFSQCQG